MSINVDRLFRPIILAYLLYFILLPSGVKKRKKLSPALIMPLAISSQRVINYIGFISFFSFLLYHSDPRDLLKRVTSGRKKKSGIVGLFPGCFFYC